MSNFWGGGTVQPRLVLIITKSKPFWVKLLQCRFMQVRVSESLNGEVTYGQDTKMGHK
jgi:hypothetical protein